MNNFLEPSKLMLDGLYFGGIKIKERMFVQSREGLKSGKYVYREELLASTIEKAHSMVSRRTPQRAGKGMD